MFENLSKNLKNLLSLTIHVEDYNLVARKPALMKKLRELTIRSTSGMNYELNSFEIIAKARPVNARILMAYQNRKLVGWALLSKENSNFAFNWRTAVGFKASEGSLFEVFIHESYRKQGIASALIKKARKITTDDIFVCPHDHASSRLFNKFGSICNKTLGLYSY